MKSTLKIKCFKTRGFAPRVSSVRTEGVSDIYRLYLREIGTVPLLTQEEQRDLFVRARGGDEEARKKIITANLRLVVKLARAYEGYGLPLLDMINEGNLGLMLAVDRYDPTKGARLSTYAAWYIKQGIRRAIANQARPIRLPVHLDYQLSVLNRTAMRLSEDLGRQPSDEEIGVAMDLPAQRVSRLRAAGLRPVSLDAPAGDDSEKTLESVLADDAAINPAEAFERQMDHQTLEEELHSLSPREQQILRRRFGLDNEPEQTLEEISSILGVTRERIRQLQNKALNKLRFRLKDRLAETA